jgi:tetratricopeptide (TPR) repeat protein
MSTIPFLVALVLFTIAHIQLRQTWIAEDAFGYSLRSIRQEQYQSAQDHLTRALQLAPDDAHYHAHLAILNERMVGHGIEPFTVERPSFDESQMDHLRKAIQSYQNTLRLNAADDFVYHNLAWLYWFTRQDDQAIESAQKAVTLNHGAYLYHVSFGVLRELRGEKEAAFREYETALYLSSGLLDSRFFRDLRRRWPQEAEALIAATTANLETELKDGFDPVLAGKLSRLYIERQPERALELLQATTRILPNLSRPWSNLGRIYELQGDKRRMKDCYERTLFLEGSHALSWYRLGSYYDELNQTQDSARAYEQAVNFSLRPESNHSWVVRRIYHSSFTLFDDVIPRGLLSYTGSNIDLPAACRRLSEIHTAAGDHNRAKHFAELGEEYARKIDFR